MRTELGSYGSPLAKTPNIDAPARAGVRFERGKWSKAGSLFEQGTRTPFIVAARNQPAFTVWSEDGKIYHGVAVRTERWRYAEFGPDRVSGALLFDEQADPLELKNLADDP